MIIEPTIHSFSVRKHFAHKSGFDAIEFAKLARVLGFQGLSLSLNDKNYRHLGGRGVKRMDRLSRYLQMHKMSLEVDTSGTGPAHMSEMLKVAYRMGATSVRTYTRHSGKVFEMIEASARDLAEVVGEAHDLGLVIVLENHEDFTGPELVQIIEKVDYQSLKVLYDYGNSQMVLEDPEAALTAVLPHVYSVHFKDHVMVDADNAGELTVAGVPIGEGFLPLEKLTQRLFKQGLRRFTFENVWAYSAPVSVSRQPLPNVVLGEGSFAYLAPPFIPSTIILDQSEFNAETLVKLENDALVKGSRAFFNILRTLEEKRA